MFFSFSHQAESRFAMQHCGEVHLWRSTGACSSSDWPAIDLMRHSWAVTPLEITNLPHPIMPIILTIRPRRAYAFATRFPAMLICEGETHGFKTTRSKGIPETQRRAGRRFHVGSSGTRDRPNTRIPTNA